MISPILFCKTPNALNGSNDPIRMPLSSRQVDWEVDLAVTVGKTAKTYPCFPGDIISTGRPSGGGIFREPPIVLKPGDVVACRVDGIGSIPNVVQAAD